MGEKERKRKYALPACLAILCLLAAAGGCKKEAPKPAKHAVNVLAAKVQKKSVPLNIKAIGNVEAYNAIPVYALVPGQVQKIYFKEGAEVKAGDRLFTIDPRPYEEKLRQAEGTLAKDRAQLAYNRAEAKRYKFLVEKGAVSKSDYDQNQTGANTQAALVETDMAAVKNAKLQLQYCYIYAPVDGKTGKYLVNEGTIIKDNDTKLIIINTIQPIYVSFSVPERYLPDIKAYMAKKPLKVAAFPPNHPKDAREGVLTFIDNAVDKQTGMILLRATFKNEDKYLWPGQFVDATLTLAMEDNALVIPTQAIGTSQQGLNVFVIKADMTVENRIVTVDRAEGGDSVITKGVSEGETVVTDGQLSLQNGFPVVIKDSLDAGMTGGAGKKETPKPGDASSGTEKK